MSPCGSERCRRAYLLVVGVLAHRVKAIVLLAALEVMPNLSSRLLLWIQWTLGRLPSHGPFPCWMFLLCQRRLPGVWRPLRGGSNWIKTLLTKTAQFCVQAHLTVTQNQLSGLLTAAVKLSSGADLFRSSAT